MSTSGTTGEITGTVSAQNGTDIGNSIVVVTNQSTGAIYSSGQLMPGKAVSFTIAGLPPGKYLAFCQPDQSAKAAPQTYRQLPGVVLGHAHRIHVHAGKTAPGINFSLPSAARLLVTVTDTSGGPLSGAMIAVQDAQKSSLLIPPVSTGSDGTAVLYNVPLAFKLAIAGPAGYETIWYGGATKFKTAQTISVPNNQPGLSLSVALSKAG